MKEILTNNNMMTEEKKKKTQNITQKMKIQIYSEEAFIEVIAQLKIVQQEESII